MISLTSTWSTHVHLAVSRESCVYEDIQKEEYWFTSDIKTVCPPFEAPGLYAMCPTMH